MRDRNRRALSIAFFVTTGFMLLEVAGGYLTGSLALLSDAGHMLSDAGALGLSLFAMWFARRPPTPEKTYGFHRGEVLAALVNAATLFAIAGMILVEAYGRLRQPSPVEGGLMLAVAVAGLLANLTVAWVLHGGDTRENLNMRGAFLHVLGDLLGSVGAISASLLILYTGWYPADPLISVVIALLILRSAWRLLLDSLNVLMEGTPQNLSYWEVDRAIREIPGVEDLHDLHLWTVTSGFPACSCHVVVGREGNPDTVLHEVTELLQGRFEILHTTVQVERSSGKDCPGGVDCAPAPLKERVEPATK